MEMRTDDLILCLEGRVVEVFGRQSDYNERIHVEMFAAESKPHGDGGAKVRLGRMRPGDTELFVGAGRIPMKLDASQWAEFQRFFEAVKAARALPA
ncbi:MAG: hypothetical protein ACJ762_10280 [Solirubrobacteraceae bacterium]